LVFSFNPRILAHHAASALVLGRSEEEQRMGDVDVSFKVIDRESMPDAVYDRFVVPNTGDKKDDHKYIKQLINKIKFKNGLQLYPRQKQVSDR